MGLEFFSDSKAYADTLVKFLWSDEQADDLEKFRVKLLTDIKMMLDGPLGKPPKRWLKSHEVRELLKISSGTLHSLRCNGKIPFARIGGLIYYDAVEIDRVLRVQKRTA